VDGDGRTAKVHLDNVSVVEKENIELIREWILFIRDLFFFE